jgi:hypothetical protein
LATIEVEAVSTVAFVLLLIEVMAEDTCEFVFGLIRATVAPSEVLAFSILVPFVFTFELIVASVAPRDVEAVVTLAAVAREPESSVASDRRRVAKFHTCEAVRFELPVESARPILPGVVRVDVATFQISAVNEPNVVRVRVADVQTLSGMVAARDVEAVRTVAFVLLLILVIADDTCEFVFGLTRARVAPSEVLALRMFVPFVVTFELTEAKVAPREVEARFVLALTAEVIPDVWAFVLAFTLATIEVEAVSTVASVFALIADCAEVTLAAVARDPAVRVASVRFRVPNVHTCEAVREEPPKARTFPIVPGVVRVDVATFHTSAARVPNVVSDLVAEVQTLSGIVAASDVDAVSTVAFVLLLIVVIADAIVPAVDAIPAVMLAASDVEAARTVAFVFELIAV